MAKEFAFLFYPGDYLRDTQCLSEKSQVAYDRIMCESIRNAVITTQQLKFFTKRLSEDEVEELLMTLTEVEGGYQITWVIESINKRKAFTESRRNSRLKCDEDNVRIYIVRDNVRSTYKIGSSTNPLRRYNELNNQKSPAIMADEQESRDLSLIWYSEPVQRKEEKILHKKFKSKHLYGEWFGLTEEDITTIYTLYKGITYDQRTLQRTEIEIEKEIVLEIINSLREVDNVSIQTGQENLYTMIVLKMMDVFKKHNPSYFFHKETDYKACLQIAYNIASMRDWKRDSVLNGNMQPCIQEWENIVQFIKNDRWFSSRSLSDISSTKEWQRINQSINNSKNTTNATDQHVIGKTFKKD
jgi:predicted GIY-YIG superfamily endonuclease